MSLERRRVTYSGRVQGVGFRDTTNRLARSFPVVGHVLNLPDGRVELVAEGESKSLDEFLNAVGARLGHFIRSSITDIEPTGQPRYDNFSVRY